MTTRFQMRRDSLINWKRANPILLNGEIGFIKDTTTSQTWDTMVIGDGIHTFKNLPIIHLNLKPQDELFKQSKWTTNIISQECFIDTENYFIF